MLLLTKGYCVITECYISKHKRVQNISIVIIIDYCCTRPGEIISATQNNSRNRTRIL